MATGNTCAWTAMTTCSTFPPMSASAPTMAAREPARLQAMREAWEDWNASMPPIPAGCHHQPGLLGQGHAAALTLAQGFTGKLAADPISGHDPTLQRAGSSADLMAQAQTEESDFGCPSMVLNSTRSMTAEQWKKLVPINDPAQRGTSLDAAQLGWIIWHQRSGCSGGRSLP